MSFDLTSPKTVKLTPLNSHDEKNAPTVRSAVQALLKPDCNMFTKGEIIHSLMVLLSVNEKQAAVLLGLSGESVKRKLSLLIFSDFEKKLILNSGICEMSAFALSALPPITRRFAVIYCAKNRLSYQNTKSYIEHIAERKRMAVVSKKDRSSRIKPKGFVANIGLVINSIEKAVSTAEESGFETDFNKSESQNHINIALTFSKKPSVRR